MKCKNCGANMQVTERTKFCPFCGATVEIRESNLDKRINFAKYQLEHEEMVRQRKEKESRKNVKLGLIIGIVSILITVLGFGAIALFGEDARMDRLANEVQQLIIQGDYDTAAIKVEGIRVEKQTFFDKSYEKYENLRNDLKKLIEQKKKESGQ